MGQDMKNSKVRRFDIIARKMKSPQARSYIQPVGLVHDLPFILSCGLPRSLMPKSIEQDTHNGASGGG